MKRVLHILSSLERSGMEKMLLSSSHEWALRGYACDVVATASDLGPLAPQMRAAGYEVFHIPFRSGFRYLPRRRFLLEYFELCRSGYDVVHIHTEAAVPVFAVLAKLAGVATIVLTPHNTFYFTGLLRARKIVERGLFRFLGGRFGMISDGVQRCEWETFRNPGVRTWNWFDTAHFRPPSGEERRAARQSLGCGIGQFVVVSVGNCNNVKNHPELLRALSLLPATIDALYLHVGREAAREPERVVAAELGIADKVRFLGSQEDIRPFLWAADAFAMPSLREGLGIAAIEAVACGAPAVLADIAGLCEVAAETKYAVVTTTQAESIANGIAQIAALPVEERSRRSLEDSERIRKRFSIENGVRSIVEGLYRPSPRTGWLGQEGTAL